MDTVLVNLMEKIDEALKLKKELDLLKDKVARMEERNRALALDIVNVQRNFEQNEIIKHITNIERKYLENIERIRQEIRIFKEKADPYIDKKDIGIEDLKKCVKLSGVGYKEIAEFLGYSPDNLTSVSQIINGHVDQPEKRLKIYSFCKERIGA